MTATITPDDHEAFINRELSWLQFARRVLGVAQDPEVPLLERVKFVGILGMLHDEFFMKRIAGLKRQLKTGVRKVSIDGLTPTQELKACRQEVERQIREVHELIEEQLRPALAEAGLPILDWGTLDERDRKHLRKFFETSVMPVLTPLAVDAEHPFPFISNLGLNLAVTVKTKKKSRFVRIKVPANRERFVPLKNGRGYVPLEQIIAENLDLLFPKSVAVTSSLFRVTRSAEGDLTRSESFADSDAPEVPGSIIAQVTDELRARRFAGEVRLEVSADMTKKQRKWLTDQLKLTASDVYVMPGLLGRVDLSRFAPDGPAGLRFPEHEPMRHPRLDRIGRWNQRDIFEEICRGDILLHHPYHDFDASVLRLLEAAAVDDAVLAIKLTIYRTSSDSAIVRTLAEAARRGKQVAVLVEITARFDEAPNIQWGQFLENEGVHVSYGVEKLKTHVKLALVVREESHGVRSYVHVGTGNYHSGTARVYEDVGILSCDPVLAQDVAVVFNELTSAMQVVKYQRLLVAPREMRSRFLALLEREMEHAALGRPCGVFAKMNQLQDPDLIRALYRASMAGVPIRLNVRGLCSLRPGVPGLSENIEVFSTLGRFLEHARIYRFANAGMPEIFIGSADWMKRNLDHRVETISPVIDPALREELDLILQTYAEDNASAWDMQPDGSYVRRRPVDGEPPRPAQDVFIDRAARHET
jgi:polyphosphate kinase